MDNILLNFVKYIFIKYPKKEDLFVSRLTKIIYLIDWKSAIDDSCLLTNSEWHLDNYGPYIEHFFDAITKDKDLDIKISNNLDEDKKLSIVMKNIEWQDHLEDRQKKIIDFVINVTKDKNYSDLSKLVFSTYPIIVGNNNFYLDLIKLAHDYNELKNKI